MSADDDGRAGPSSSARAWGDVFNDMLDEFMGDLSGDITDEQLALLIAGWLAGAVHAPAFPVDVAGVERVDASAFDLITASGLRYRVAVEMRP
jgi:ABC-type transporter Mla MlaB component